MEKGREEEKKQHCRWSEGEERRPRGRKGAKVNEKREGEEAKEKE